MGCSPHRRIFIMNDDRSMSTHPSRLERLLIFAADEEGRIPFPKCKESGLPTIRRALAQLKKRGLVQRGESTHLNGSSYVLTDSGKSCRAYMVSGTIQNEVDSMNWNREEPDSHSSGLLYDSIKSYSQVSFDLSKTMQMEILFKSAHPVEYTAAVPRRRDTSVT